MSGAQRGPDHGSGEAHDRALDFASRFVAGEIPETEYLQELYTGTSLDALRSWAGSPAYCRGDALLYLLELDLGTPQGRLDTLNLLGDYLRAHDREPDPGGEQAARSEVELLIRAQPAWVDVPGTLARELLNKTQALEGADQVRALRTAITARFRSLKRPPRWLQSPQWPFVDGEPCLFVGQHDITPLRHDTATLYVFIHQPTGRVETVEQST